MAKKKMTRGQKVIEVLNALDSAWRDERSMDLDERYMLMKSRVAKKVREIC